MTKRALLGSVSFSHLLGRAPKAGGRAEEEREDKDKRDTKDDDKARKGKSRAEEDGGDDEKEERRREEDEQDQERRDEDDKDKKERREDEDEQDEREDEEEGEDEEDERDKKDAKASAARKRERARCAAIFASKHAAGRPDFAAHLAFNTSLGRNAAIAMLKAAPQPAQGGLSARMAGMEAIRPGADGGRSLTTRQARSASWDASAKRVGVAPR